MAYDNTRYDHELPGDATQGPTVPEPWKFSTSGIAIRLFITCWLIYSLHFSTNIVREIYPALALGDHFSFRVDEYANMHPDLFEKEGYGWHIGNNPGASMVAAIPYALARPIIDRLVERVMLQRKASGKTEPPSYNSPWPMAREFFNESWRRGFDIKFGLAAFVMQAFCMAPLSALGVVVMFYLLRLIFLSDRKAFWLAILYAFGTPVFFRTGFLNHNMMLGHLIFMGFVTIWNPAGKIQWSKQKRYFLGGLSGGAAFLFDNSGVILLLGLFIYGVIKCLKEESLPNTVRLGIWYVAGTLGPVGLLWFYQWKSFGNPFLPGQHYMPPVEWIDIGYQGFSWPQWEILRLLAIDYRYGIFTSAPLYLLALVSPVSNRKGPARIPHIEFWAMIVFCLVLWLFFGGVQYTRLQFNTGIRYLAPLFPFLFVLSAQVLDRLPRLVVYLISIFCITESWCLSMYRDVERGLGLLDPIAHVFMGGFQLPALTTLSRMGGQYGEYFSVGVSPLPLFALLAAVLFGIWFIPNGSSQHRSQPSQ